MTSLYGGQMLNEQFGSNKIKQSFSLRRLLVLILIVLVTAMVVVSAIWWKLSGAIDTQKNHIDSLEIQIETLSEKIEDISK